MEELGCSVKFLKFLKFPEFLPQRNLRLALITWLQWGPPPLPRPHNNLKQGAQCPIYNLWAVASKITYPYHWFKEAADPRFDGDRI